MTPTTAQPAPGSSTKRGQACERCWKRKQKCDRLLPACTACADLGVECLVRAQEVDLAADDVGLAHATIHSYMDVLRRRVADLQRSSRPADAASPLRKRLRTASFSRTSATAASMSPLDAAVGDDSSVRDTMGAIGFLSNSAMAEPTAGGVGEVEGSAAPHRLAHTEVVLAALAVAGHDPSVASASTSGPGTAQTALLGDHQLPLGRDALLGHVKRLVDSSLVVMVPSYLDEKPLCRASGRGHGCSPDSRRCLVGAGAAPLRRLYGCCDGHHDVARLSEKPRLRGGESARSGGAAAAAHLPSGENAGCAALHVHAARVRPFQPRRRLGLAPTRHGHENVHIGGASQRPWRRPIPGCGWDRRARRYVAVLDPVCA
ncbi:hypothetical protein RB595_010387 [Gaeumannomyces hyphopodioides]